MAPFLDADIINSLHSAEAAGDHVAAEAVKTLKAVQELLNSYFSKSTLLTPETSPKLHSTTESTSPDNHSLSDSAGEPQDPPAAEKDDKSEPENQEEPTIPSTTEAKDNTPEAAGSSIPHAPAQPQQTPSEIGPNPNPKQGPSGPPGPPGPRINPERLRALAAEISGNVEQLVSASGTGPGADAARLKTSKAVLELSNALRPPPEIIMGWFSNMCVVSAVRVFQNWGVFDLIPAPTPSGPQGISYAELAEKVNAEESLLVRMSWMLTATSVLRHIPGPDATTPNRLAHTPISMLLRAGQPMGCMFKVMYTNVAEVSTILPAYFDQYGRHEPIGPNHIPTSFLAGVPELEYFEHLNQDPARIDNFMRAMSITHRNVPTTGMYDMGWVLKKADEERDRLIWVDVGGSDGHTVKIFCKEYGLRSEQCAVQDLPEVVEVAEREAKGDEELKGMKWLPMNFHREGPVAGALVYYLRHVLRDYSDPVSVTILRNLASSLTCPDSRILIAEQLTVTPPAIHSALKDYTMLAIGGKERTLDGFAAVADAAGLVISGVFRDKATPHAVLELKLKEGSGTTTNGPA